MLLLACAALVLAAWAVMTPGAEPGRGHWAAAALASPLSAACLAVLLAGTAALAMLGRAMWRIGRGRRLGSQEGVALLEFAMVLPFALMIVLVMAQSSLLMGGNLCVHYASYCAARSAAVTVPAYFGDSEPANVVGDPADSRKLARIRDAAAWAVMPISCAGPVCPASQADLRTLRGGVTRFLGWTPLWMDERIARRLQYSQEYYDPGEPYRCTEVELANPAEAPAYGAHEDLAVTVRHVFYLSVPYAGWLFRILDRTNGVEMPRFGPGQNGIVIRTSCRMVNEGEQEYIDVEHFAPRG